MIDPRRGRRAGLTLVEVVIAVAVFTILSLAMLMTFMPMTRSTTLATIGLEMDREARAVFAQLRREMRQSGFSGATPMYTLDPGGLNITGFTEKADVSWDVNGDGTIQANEVFEPELAFRRCLGPNPPLTGTTIDWSEWTLYTTVPNPQAPRDIVQRRVLSGAGPFAVAQRFDIISNVNHLLFRQDAGSLTIHMVLVLERINPHETDPDPKARILQRVYQERVELLNPQVN